MSKWVLITGASSGIGWEFAKVFAKTGCNLVLVARRKGRLNLLEKEIIETTASKVFVIQADLSKTNSPTLVFKILDKKRIKIDVLVNNAGFGLAGDFLETDIKREFEMVEVNIKALMGLSKEYLKRIDFTVKDVSRGIINVSSIASFMVGPTASIYYATKAFVTSFSKSLALELNGKLTITAVCPGLTRSEFDKVSGMNKKQSKLYEMFYMSAHDVAEIGYKAFIKRKTIEITGLRNKLALITLKILNLY